MWETQGGMAGLQPERVKVATAWRFAYLVIQGGLSTVLFVWLAQVLPPGPFAACAVAQGVLVIAQAVGDFGLSQAAVTALPARIARSPKEQDALTAGAARAFLVAAVAALMLALMVVLVVPAEARVPVALVAPAAGAAVLVGGADGLLRAVGEFGRPVFLLLISRVAAFAAVPVAIATDSATWTCAALSVGAVVGSLPAGMSIWHRARWHSRARTREIVATAFPLGLSQLLIVASGRLNTVVVSALATVSVAAAFEGAWRLYQLGQYVAGGLATAVAPFVGHALGARRHTQVAGPLMRLAAIMAILGGCWMMVLLAFGEPLSTLLLGQSYGAQVADAIPPLALVSPIAFVAFVAMMTLAASDQDRAWILVANVFGSAVNLVLVFTLASAQGAKGASIAAAAGIGVAGVLMCLRFGRVLTRTMREEVSEGGRSYASSGESA